MLLQEETRYPEKSYGIGLSQSGRHSSHTCNCDNISDNLSRNDFFLFAKGHVVMGTQASSVYQQVMEKTKGLLFKCQVLEQNYEKKKKSGTSDNYASKVRK